MVGVRLEDCTKWLVRGLRIAPNGCKWPQHKKATIKWQFGDRAGQLKKLWHGNQGIAPAKRKIAARQSMDCAGQKKKNCSAAIRVLRRPLQKIATMQSGYCACLFKNGRLAIRVSCLPFQNLCKAWVSRQMVDARLEDCAKGWCEA
jgi:hypothetical protein